MAAEAFAEALKRIRLAKGLSQSQLAEKAGLHKMVISKLERGEHSPAWETVLALAEAPMPKEATLKARRWRIPVAYGGENGIDLEDVAKHFNTTPDAIVAKHAAGQYRVAMIGF